METIQVPYIQRMTEKTPKPAYDISNTPEDPPKKIIQPKATARLRHSVTFAPIVDSRSPSPAAQNQPVFISHDRTRTNRCELDTITWNFPNIIINSSDAPTTSQFPRQRKEQAESL